MKHIQGMGNIKKKSTSLIYILLVLKNDIYSKLYFNIVFAQGGMVECKEE